MALDLCDKQRKGTVDFRSGINIYSLELLVGFVSLSVKELKGRKSLECNRWQWRRLIYTDTLYTEASVGDTHRQDTE